MSLLLDSLSGKKALSFVIVVLALAAACVVPSVTQAQEEAEPASRTYADRLLAIDDVPLRVMPSVDLGRAALEDAEDEALGLPPRFAIPNPVHITPATDGVWETVDENTLVWRLQVHSRAE